MAIVIDDLKHQVNGDNADLKVVIGNLQPGSHTWYGGIEPEKYPPPDESTWITELENPKGKCIKFFSSTRNSNPNTDWVSVEVYVDGTKIEDERLSKEVSPSENVNFDITLCFE